MTNGLDVLAMRSENDLSVGQCAALACILEALAPKAGNVHRGADFGDMSFADFCLSAVAIVPAMEAAGRGEPLGKVVLCAIQATRALVAPNTNLGTVLLLAPLACVPRAVALAEGVKLVLRSLSSDDAANVYQAIRLANPGGLGRVEQADVNSQPPSDLLGAMRLAMDRDLVARQYVEDFALVLYGVPQLVLDGVGRGWTLLDAIVHAQLRLMSEHPDSLIARKCGAAVAREAADRAAEVLAHGLPGEDGYLSQLADFDFWLRADGCRRNPGTTADLIAAGLFVLLRERRLDFPLRLYPSE